MLFINSGVYNEWSIQGVASTMRGLYNEGEWGGGVGEGGVGS